MWRRRSSRANLLRESGQLEKPALFALHMCTAVLVTVKIAAMVSEDTPFIVASRGTFMDMFLAGVTRQGDTGFIYEIDSCLDSINRSIHTYYNLPSVGLDVYDALSTPIQIHLVHLKENPRQVLPRRNNRLVQDLETNERYANVSGKGDDWMALLGIDAKSMSKKRSFFNSLVQLDLLFQLRTLHREFDHVQLFDWDIWLHCARRAHRVNSYGQGVACPFGLPHGVIEAMGGGGLRADTSLHWELALDALMAAMALFSQLTAHRWKQGLLSAPGGGSRWIHRNVWMLVTAGADLLILTSAFLDFSDYLRLTGEMRSYDIYVTGMACMLSWSSIIQHLQPVQPYNMLILAMARGVPVVARFLIGSIPLLMGFAGLGMALFSEHTEKFSSLENSAVTLFSVLNGDVLLETWREIRPAGFMGDVFLVSFVCIFVYSGLNVFISIIQDAYMSAKEQTSSGPGRQSTGSSERIQDRGPERQEPLMAADRVDDRLEALEVQLREILNLQRQVLLLCSPRPAPPPDAAESQTRDSSPAAALPSERVVTVEQLSFSSWTNAAAVGHEPRRNSVKGRGKQHLTE